MAISTNAPIPRAPISTAEENPATGAKEQVVSLPFAIFFRDLRADIDDAPRIASTPVTVPGSNATVATTDILVPAVEGLYSFQFYAAVVTAAAVSSSLTPVLGWTDHGVPKTHTFAAMTGNTSTTTASEAYMIFSDANAPITYALTYASNAAGVMVYDFYAVLSSVAGVS